MSFLSNYSGSQRKIISNLSGPNTVKASEEVRDLEIGVSKDGSEFVPEKIESQLEIDNIEGQYFTVIKELSSKETK